jgi:hypothetical protein
VTESGTPHIRLPSAVVHGSLEAGITVCLAFLRHDPRRFEAAAVAWHARWCGAVGPVGFADSAAVLRALEGLAGPDPASAALELARRCRAHGLDEVADVLDAWREDRAGSGSAPGPLERPGRPVAA